MGSSLIEKFKGLETKGKYLVIASLVTALGFILPWINIPLVGSMNALHGWLIIVFLLSIATAGLMLYKPKYAPIMAFVVGGLLLLKFFGLITDFTELSGCVYKSINCYINRLYEPIKWHGVFGYGGWFSIFFDFEVFDLLKTGFYVTYIGAITMVYYGFKCLKGSNK